jgi:hypothetical protein
MALGDRSESRRRRRLPATSCSPEPSAQKGRPVRALSAGLRPTSATETGSDNYR